MKIQTINPNTGKILNEYPTMSQSEVDEIITHTHFDFITWSAMPLAKRSQKMQRASELLLENKDQYALLMAREMGKPIQAGIAEIEKCALLCNYYAEHTKNLLAPEVIKTELSKSYVTYEPTGIVFGIMPWNFPFWQVFRFAVPNLMAGNACLLKHASISTGSALAIEALFRQAGFPSNIFRSILIETSLANFVIAHPKIAGVSLTGSEKAGQAVAGAAGKNLKPVVLELGGSDPYLILEDADLNLAAEICVQSRLNNSGQVCIAAKRIIAVGDTFEALQPKIINQIKKYTLGNPELPTTTLGPMARADLRQTVHLQVTSSIALGAKLLLGGELPPGPGFFYPPTLLTEVKPEHPVFYEEVFGPVICLIRANNENEGIALANQTPYGLGAGVFTNDLQRGERIAVTQLKAGTCAVNTAVHSIPNLPFGGSKQSGYGRELGSYGLKAFLNIKTIQIN